MWFNEGHAEYFGALQYVAKESKMYARPNQWRLEPAQTAVNNGTTVPLSKLVQMTHAEFYDPKTIGRNYAQAWSFVYFLWECQNGKYRSYVTRYFDALRNRCGLKKAYDTVFGKTDMKKLEAEWKAFVQKLKPVDATK
ncbi:MAG: DUF1570 domain-containing protein, partial [Planctomycetota bacterium]|nr:DUF1570 domain-containing protein [Planctomycetota bacterium]